MTYDPQTYEQAQTAIESIEQQLNEIQDACSVQDFSARELDGISRVYNDLVAQRDAIAERAVDLPTEAELRAQRDEDDWRNIRNEPYGGDDFADFNSGDCW